MPELKEGAKATAKRDKCVADLKGKTNPRTGKPYTDSERYAVCTAAIKKAYEKPDSERDAALEAIEQGDFNSVETNSVFWDGVQKVADNLIVSDNSKGGSRAASAVYAEKSKIAPDTQGKNYPVTQEDQDGQQELKGRTDEARSKGVLHDHPYVIVAKLDDAGELVFEGETGPASKGPEHTHAVKVTASNPDQTEYEFDTEDGSDGSSAHLVKVVLDSPMSSDGQAIDDTEAMMSKAPAVITESRLRRWGNREEGIVCFADGFDGRRHYKDTTLAFCASFTREKSTSGPGKIKLEADGRLKRMVYRTGTFVHPFYGVINSTEQQLNDIKSNFDRGVLGQAVPINIHHQNALGAIGLHDELAIEPDTFATQKANGEKVQHEGLALYSYDVLTPFGHRELIQDQKYFYSSAELMVKLTDQERFAGEGGDGTQEGDGESEDKTFQTVHRNVLVGSAVTNTPFIPRMKSLAASSEDVNEAYAKLLSRHGGNVNKMYEAVRQELERRGIF